MARTGERYAVARAHVIAEAHAPEAAVAIDHGWRLRGGTDPDAAALANVLAHRGVTSTRGELDEPLLFVIGGGVGAGYILWEFAHDDSRIVTLGFASSWQYFDRRLRTTVERFGIDAEWTATGGAVGAARALRAALAAGDQPIIWPDRHQIGYWHLPALLDGMGGHPVVAYARSSEGSAERVHIDDRSLAPLTVSAEAVDRARARVGSYRNTMLVVRASDAVVPDDRLRAAVLSGLQGTVEKLGGASTSFALPAWQKWAKLLVDTRADKGWPSVFADGRGQLRALADVWEAVAATGIAGGHLRGLFADGLERAAAVLDEPALAAEAPRWRAVAGRWHALAELTLPHDVPALARLRALAASVTGAVAEGDASAGERAEAAAELWRLRAEHDDAPPLDADALHGILTAMSEELSGIHGDEAAAIERLRGVVGVPRG